MKFRSNSSRRRLLAVVIPIILLAASTLCFMETWPATPARAQGRTGMVLAFYYAWYNPESFGPGKTAFQPPQPYLSSDPGTIQRHVGEARAAGIDGFVQSWYGPSEPVTNGNFQALLDIGSANGFKAAIDFEPSVTYSNNDQRAAALQQLLATHATHPAYLRMDGKPVIFFWANWAYSVDDWAYIRNIADPGHNSIWIAEGARTEYLQVFDGLHLYNTAWSANPHGIATTWGANTRAASDTYGTFKYWVATAMPGFDDRHLGRGEASVYRHRGDGAYYQNSFAAAAASSPDLLIITSFNEWAEGSNIEPSTAFGNTYLDLTAQLVAGYKAGGVAPPPPLPDPSIEPTSATGAESTATVASGPTSVAQLPTATAVSPADATPTPDSDGRIVYEVEEGDTLSAIAFRFDIGLDELYRLNDLDENSLLTIGQTLVVGLAAGAATESGVTPVPQPNASVTSAAPSTYQVQQGDTLLGIALQHNLTMEALLSLNPTLTESTLLQLGQQIVVAENRQPASVGGSTDFPEGTATVTSLASSTSQPTSTPAPTRTPPTQSPVVTATQVIAVLDEAPTEASIEATRVTASEISQPGPAQPNTPTWLILVAAFVLLAGGGGIAMFVMGSRRTESKQGS